MGVSVSAATAILLVGALISFGVVYSAQDSAQTSYIEAQSSMADRLNNALMTDLEINTAISVYNASDVFLYSQIILTNIGSKAIDLEKLNLLINGSFHFFSYEFLDFGGTSYWLPEDVIVLTVDEEFKIDETYRICVVTPNGVTDFWTYGGN